MVRSRGIAVAPFRRSGVGEILLVEMGYAGSMFSKADGPSIMAAGEKMAKKRNPVFLARPQMGGLHVESDGSFAVETNEGVLRGKTGDYLAYDPISGHVWPVAASYVEQHYELF